MRFLGNIGAKADAKGRIFFPASFRKELQLEGEERLVLRKDIFQECLVLYPERTWDKQLAELRSKLNHWNALHQAIFRQFVSDVELVTLDANGRILIPKRYMKLMGAAQEVKFIGMDSTIELWAREEADKPFVDPEVFMREIGEIMNKGFEGKE